jgi:hypothetical protein
MSNCVCVLSLERDISVTGSFAVGFKLYDSLPGYGVRATRKSINRSDGRNMILAPTRVSHIRNGSGPSKTRSVQSYHLLGYSTV